MTELGFLLAVVVGLTLGLIGGGGSILTVPILVYVVGVDPVSATAYSLFIVGIAAVVGAGAYLWRREVRVDVALGFGLPSILAVYATRRFLVPALPPTLFYAGELPVTRDLAIMVLFAVLMVVASLSMIRGRRELGPRHSEATDSTVSRTVFVATVMVEGAVVGTLTGLVGAGGGFLIVPALVVLAGRPMKTAVGTSLVIIAGKSLIGFAGDLAAARAVDWQFLSLFAGFTVLGILVGTVVSRRVRAERLKPAFGWFVLIAGGAVLAREFLFL
jgi:uncharacterized membrane protein YfcA